MASLGLRLTNTAVMIVTNQQDMAKLPRDQELHAPIH